MRKDCLIFIISLPRSGSTLLQHILGSHSKISASAEPWVLFPTALALRPKSLMSDYQPEVGRIALVEFLGEIENGEQEFYGAVRKYADHLYQKFREKNGKSYYLDKTSRYYLILPELQKIYPDAKYIFLLRNPLAIFSSFVESMVKGNLMTLSSPGFKNDLLEGLHLINDSIKQFENRIVVKYEDLVTSPKETVKNLCAYLKVDFEEDMINYGKLGVLRGQLVDRKSIHVHTTPVQSYLDNWKKVIDSNQRHTLAKSYISYLGERLISDLGYDSDKINEDISKQRFSSPKFIPQVSWEKLFGYNNIYQKNMIGLIFFWQKFGFLSFAKKFLSSPLKNLYSLYQYVRY